MTKNVEKVYQRLPLLTFQALPFLGISFVLLVIVAYLSILVDFFIVYSGRNAFVCSDRCKFLMCAGLGTVAVGPRNMNAMGPPSP